ncbi:MFS transporter [Pleionea mediterranea]|uniref:MFS-type transporter involved in bile tolerance (Atg22 family) n=1 Tax=Pleionea mediterranea TaxID=523701 RepID=A0A316G086_9GAMM|nr:MFS transporter [Pleionea mediterranea]PWK53210.1 MFS-type transporter involved in bile tolerance (Atg22 family) [Pleionea mediterranea]
MKQPSSQLDQAYQLLTSEDDGRVCRDIPESACEHQPRNFILHILSLAATKSSDGLIDPKLILSWLLAQLGASALIIGQLVPVREAGALLPQLFTSEWIRKRPQRKWVWAAGSFVQGLCVAGMVICCFTLTDDRAGLAILILLAILAVARSFCSVSYKDVLGKTVSKSTRGTATGTAGTIASASVILFASLLTFNIIPLSIFTLSITLSIASGLWLIAAALFTQLNESSGATDGGENATRGLRDRLSLIVADKQLFRFITVRALLVSTALAPPFMLLTGTATKTNANQQSLTALTQSGTEGFLSQLGLLILASSLAGFSSSYIWGRLADKSSRNALIVSALIAGLTLASTAIIHITQPVWLTTVWLLPILLFLLMIAYQGVRLARSTHLVDMAHHTQRANYTAVSNTVIGIVLLLGGLFGVLAELFGVTLVIGLFAAMSFIAAALAVKLKNVQS